MCTRAVYIGPEATVLTARSMDWKGDMGSNLYCFPRGMARDGGAGPKSIRWISKYGSVAAAVFEIATADGMNEQGLVANLLYLAESEYVTPAPNDARAPMSVTLWTQYVLDNFATVAEAVAALAAEPFYVVPIMTPDGEPGAVHLAISDASGDSAIFEYVGGKLNIHHDRRYQVMTNSPIFEHQIAINAYWQEIGGATMLPGTDRAADRFVRASFYIQALPQTADMVQAVAGAFSVIRNASVPLGIATPDKPNLSSTLWRTVSDHKHKRYYFESAFTPNVFWVNLEDLKFASGSPTKKLCLTDGTIYAGNAGDAFQISAPLQFRGVAVQ